MGERVFVTKRTLASVKDLNDIDKVLKDRKNPPKPAFKTANQKRASELISSAPPPPTTLRQARPPTGASVPQSRSPSATMHQRGSSVSSRARDTYSQPIAQQHYSPPSSYSGGGVAVGPFANPKALPRRTPAPVSNTEANSNFALLVARDVSRQPENSEEIRRQRLAEQYKISINRRYNMVVDEADVIRSGEDGKDEDNEGQDHEGHGEVDVTAHRRLIRPVSKKGLRSDYYVPNRKHTLAELRKPNVIPRERVLEVAAKLDALQEQKRKQQQQHHHDGIGQITTPMGLLSTQNIVDIVDFIGKAGKSLGTVALINKAFATVVEAKLLEEDETETNDEALRRLRVAREAVSEIPSAFYKAILALKSDPPAKVCEALGIVMFLISNGKFADALPTPPSTSSSKGNGQTTSASSVAVGIVTDPREVTRGLFECECAGEDGEGLTTRLVSLDPYSIDLGTSTALRGLYPALDELSENVSEYNTHAGTLIKWVSAVLGVAHPQMN